MIKSIKDKPGTKIEIDLTGPDGNAFVIMNVAKHLCKQLGRDSEPVLKQMMAGDYENLLNIFEQEFGNFVIMYR